jgi:hypothetical protein
MTSLAYTSTPALFSASLSRREYDVHLIIRQNETAGTGFGGDFNRNRSHAGGQDSGHVARALRLDQLRFTDRLAGQERRPGDGTRELGNGLRPLGFADEPLSGRRSGPSLPAQLFLCHRSAQPDIRIGDQNVGRLELRGGGGRRRRWLRSARQQSGNAAGGEGDDEHYDTRGFHNRQLLPTTRCNPTYGRNCHTMPRPITWSRTLISAAKGQGMVNEECPN